MFAPNIRNCASIVAETDHYQLLDLGNDSRLGFRQFKLVSKQPMHKANWWLGWNGERLARSHDVRFLHEHNPEVYDWVVSTLTEFKKGIEQSTQAEPHEE